MARIFQMPFLCGGSAVSAAGVSGTWNAQAVEDLLGENMGVAKLPTVEIDGDEESISYLTVTEGDEWAFEAELSYIYISGSGKLDDEYSFLSCDADHVVVETVKKAYEDDSVIFRAYEYENRNADVTFTPGFEVKKAYLCDMMENELSEIPVVDGKITLPVGNYEIVTVKLVK